ncbi:metal-dependent hydrolase family protein [Nakamurella endophytica]|uniref:Peptidase M38 n=1 Tax=Nakamurella endophytica TaxID=1748367 RepID=A0A917SWB4_9ACTN|nr:amidohydrolase family protein [Nakamurella endophytica]GGL98745.1 peptidase M38 [Nakamurella endophytica]
MTTAALVLDDCRVVDVATGAVSAPTSVVVQDGRIASIGAEAAPAGARHLRLDGAHLVPGLIDCHVHAAAWTADLASMSSWTAGYTGIAAAANLTAMLHRGFTRVRDVGGADWGLAQAGQDRLFDGPFLHFGGKALSQTGGHGDSRGRGDDCGCAAAGGIGRVADGVDAVRTAVREERRRGASHIKIMLSGGVASPSDVLEQDQYSDAEIAAAVEEAHRGGIYVAAHAYTAASMQRGAALGVRSFEHGNHLDDAAAQALVDHDAYLVPTLATYYWLGREGTAAGLPAGSLAKLGDLYDAGLAALRLARRAGVRVAFGTDLLGAMQVHQSDEFSLRAAVETPLETLRSATTVAAELLGIADRVGRVEVGMTADLVAVSGDPLADPAVLADPDTHLRLVLVGGEVRVSRLDDGTVPA